MPMGRFGMGRGFLVILPFQTMPNFPMPANHGTDRYSIDPNIPYGLIVYPQQFPHIQGSTWNNYPYIDSTHPFSVMALKPRLSSSI